MLYFFILIGIILIYFLFVIDRLGLYQRIPLALGKISIENISERAAKKYGEKIIFTTDKPCSWSIPEIEKKFPGDVSWSALKINSTTGLLAKMLREIFQMKLNERVGILKQNHFDIHLFIVSIIKAGGIACPINGKFASENIDPYLSHLGSRLLITDIFTLKRLIEECKKLGALEQILLTEKKGNFSFSESENIIERFHEKFPGIHIEWLDEAVATIYEEAKPVKRTKNDILYLVHSSGTTGFPKAVVLQNGPQSHAIRGWLCYVHISRKYDKAYLAVPNNHQAVILSFNALLLMGMKVHWTCNYDWENFDAEKILEELYAGNYTGFFGFPITYTQLKEKLKIVPTLLKMRFWACTADASHEAIIKPFIKNGNVFKCLGIPLNGSIFLDAQGSSEVGTPSVIRYISPLTKKFERRIGKPGSTPFGPEIRIRNAAGILAARNEAGRLEVKGKTVFKSYWCNPSLTEKSFTDGWFFTGDIAQIDDENNLIQLDREVDVIHTENGPVYSLPIEEKIHKHPAIFDACVYAGAMENNYQKPFIAVALREGYQYTPDELLTVLNELLMPSEQIYYCEIINWKDFPIGVTGKTLKRVFREQSQKQIARKEINSEPTQSLQS